MDLRYPNITGATEREQLGQVKSYLHQLVDYLQWAFNNVGKPSQPVVLQQTNAKETSSDNTQATFNAVKGLIIKSADIVEACYEEVSKRLEGEYVAKSDFGTYSEQTTQDINENASEIERLFANVQTILTDIENIEYTLVETNAHIRSGLLYYDEDEIPVYGVEVGQKVEIDGAEVFNKYARFTSGRLSFYDHNGVEVAYISDKKLYITHVEITGTYRIGGFGDTVLSDGGVVTKWIGG